jgi:hypothetical protein
MIMECLVQLRFGALPAAVAAVRKQEGHRQSSPDPRDRIGSRTGAAAHQQSPSRLQWKAAPQRAQTRSRDGV